MKLISHAKAFLLFYYFLYLSRFTVNAFLSASFYGNSFIFEKHADFSSDTIFRLQFQTQSLNGLLFIAAGQQDYLIVALKNGLLQVRIDVGAGESTLVSEARYNNLLWHELVILRTGMRIDLRVNDQNVASSNIWTTSEDDRLDVDLGIFLGGYDTTVGASYMDKPLPFFRGCILNAEFNAVDILNPLLSIPNRKIVHNIKAGCSKIFHARRNEPVTFNSASSFLKYQRWTNNEEGSFECYVRTTAEHGLILFNSGWQKQEFVGLEMVGGTIRGSLNRGAGVIGLQSTQAVNDGQWHKIRFSFSSSQLEIRVDKNRTQVFVEQANVQTGTTDFLEADLDYSDIHLKGPLYIGGLDPKMKSVRRVLTSGLKVDSFPGCMRNIRINHRPKTFGDIVSSHDVAVGCKPRQKFSSKNVQSGLSALPTFVIVPQPAKQISSQAVNIKATKSDEESVVLETEAVAKKDLHRKVCYKLNLNDFAVVEGGSCNISQDVINFEWLPLESQRRFSNDNAMSIFTFYIVSPPSHGRLLLDKSGISNASPLVKTLTQNKLVYVHDGSESQHDVFMFSVGQVGREAAMRRKDGKSYNICDNNFTAINSSMIYSLNISISPIDDVPSLVIRSSDVFTPVRNSKTPLPKEIFQATDPDSLPSEIFYHLLGVGAGLYLENRDSSGRPTNVFTQDDINKNKIYFVHAGGPDNTRLLLQVSNKRIYGGDISSTVVLRVSTRNLVISVTNNTGITLVEGEAMLLSPNHLSCTSNAGDSIIDVQYNIQNAPDYGQIQVLMGTDGSSRAWTAASTFHESDLRNGRIRYLNIGTSGETSDIINDMFTFYATASGEETDSLTFTITILRVVVSVNALPVDLRGGKSSFVLTPDELQLHYTALTQVLDSEVQFIVLESFKNGALMYSDTGLLISSGDAFTLSDLKNGRLEIVVYANRIAPDVKKLQDFMRFYGVVRGRYRSPQRDLRLTYIPDTKAIKITSNILVLDEGAESRITQDRIFAETLLHKRFLFEVSKSPQHGLLILRQVAGTDDSSNQVHGRQDNVTSFTTRDIVDERLYYRHDGSESSRDSFQYKVTPILDGELPEIMEALRNVSAEGTLNITVALLNDNPPVRVVNQPFHVVRNGERLLTKHDLWYHDPDVDQDDLDLKYVRRGITNGEIINATSKRREKLFEFTQRDIITDQVLFRHYGRNFGRFVFWVRDGKEHFVTGLFIVRASEAYVQVKNSSKLLVEKDSLSAITSSNMQAESNINGVRSEMKYSVIDAPLHGSIVKVTNSSEDRVASFTQLDINDRRIFYRHDGLDHMHDDFNYSITVGSMTAHGDVTVQIFLASLQQPPVMKHNRLVVVQQGSFVTIGRTNLRAIHPDVRPRDLVYTIKLRPSCGQLLLNLTGKTLNFNAQLSNATVFSQWNINQGQLVYLQDKNMSFDSIEPVDNFTFDVSNGFLSLQRVTSHIEAVPTLIPLRAGNFGVVEGFSKVLVSKYLSVASEHFDHLNINIMVIRQPMNGRLESSRDTGERLTQFSLRLVQAEFVYYVHDGSDTLKDIFQLQAQSEDGERQSAIVSVHVTVFPVNDQPPQLVNNTGMTVWVNSATTISPENLATLDPDSPASNLTYEILPPQHGHISFKSSPSVPVVNFTQADINDGNVVFVHSGSNTGGFTFQVNDHLNFDVKHIFVITARPLIITVAPTNSLQVFPSTFSQLTSENLHSKTNDKTTGPGARDIDYYVTKQPNVGRIVKKILTNQTNGQDGEGLLSKIAYKEAESFSQTEIDAGLVYYQQSTELLNWQTKDEITLTARSDPADEVEGISLKFNITYDAYMQAQRNSSIKINKGALVREGGSFNLTSLQLDATNLFKKLGDLTLHKRYDLRYFLISPPMHGQLSVAGRLLSINDTFLHKFLDQNLLRYNHDDSEGPEDSFEFEAYLRSRKRSSKPEKRISLQDVFHITVQQVNDNPPRLETKSPNLGVVQGFQAILNRSHLLAYDVDNPASEVIYTMIRLPTYGKLYSIDGNSMPPTSVSTFTQDDVNNYRVVYVQNEPGHDDRFTVDNATTADAFYFSLSDGYNKASYSLFRIQIKPVTLDIKASTISLAQGRFSVDISSDVIETHTNGHLHLLSFNLITSPKSGALFKENKEVTSFDYDDLTSTRITYVMSRLDHENDHMTLVCLYNDTRINYQPNSTAHLSVIIKPLIKTGNLEVRVDGITQITLDALDASELANITSSVPIYEVTRRPKMAKIVLRHNDDQETRKSADQSNLSSSVYRRSVEPKPTTTFTHNDVASGNVYLSVDFVNMTDIANLTDELGYRLTVKDKTVQPAVGAFQFTLLPPSVEDIIEATSALPPEETTYEGSSPPHKTSTGTNDALDSNTTTVVITTTNRAIMRKETTKGINIQEVVDAEDSPFPWLIPLIVGLCVLILIIVIVIFACIYQKRREKQGPAYVRGHESAVLRAPASPPSTVSAPAQPIVNPASYVTVTSRSDYVDSSEHCPTVPVIVTPLRSMPNVAMTDDEPDVEFFDDGYMSNSMPHEGILSSAGMHYSVAGGHSGISSVQGFGDGPSDASRSMDFYSSPIRAIHRNYQDTDVASEESGESAEIVAILPRRNASTSSLSYGDKELTSPPLRMNQYWV
ncbi:chondroitin sulfate proteoglycan 4-like [Clavelina lepadiformis]|uniref:chondroitin sulfate proteoglycan 4-like n=1 Tax=Clavelina lepadiformis TaxID=159417 RepID=UPI0040428829